MDLPVVIVAGIAVLVGFAAAAFVGISEALPTEVGTSLLPVRTDAHPGGFVIIDLPPSGVARGIQIGLLCLVLGGLPAAILAAALAKRPRWSAGWGTVFRAGLVFQLSSLALTAVILTMLLWAALVGDAETREVVSFGGPLVLSIGCGAWGLHSWRSLEFRVRPAVPRIVP